jgi:uncharacterized protein YpiB (UPF0302 family)
MGNRSLAESVDSGKLALAIPEECPHMIVFDDADVKPIMFAGSGSRHAALKTFEKISHNWNAHLFVRIASNSRDDKHPVAAVADMPEIIDALKELLEIHDESQRLSERQCIECNKAFDSLKTRVDKRIDSARETLANYENQ